MTTMPLFTGTRLIAGLPRRPWAVGAVRVAGVATLGTFTALYFLAYAAGRRWPLRPKGSMGYRAHPHLRKKFP